MASVLHPTEPPEGEPSPTDYPLDEETRDRIERVHEEKEQARREPGPSWHDWLYFDAFRWWFMILFLIVDSWVAVTWIEIGNYVGLGLSLVAVAYAEYLAYQALWHRPELPLPRLRRGEKFHRTCGRPVETGRWTPERALLNRGAMKELPEGAVDPDEFL